MVFGRVQGVGYRAFASRIAKSLGLVGYVKNMPDGNVQMEVEGDRQAIDKLLILCKAGPGWANVEKINATESPVQGFQDFKVRY